MKKLFYSLLLLLSSISLGAQTAETEKRVLSNLASQILAFPQEKIYLQTDRPYYVCGEQLFFRAFLQHASLNRPLYLSRYVYVELIDPADELVSRQQIRLEEDKMFYGALSLPEDMPEGYYRIRCYTRYMENMGEESFYSRPVFIAHPNAARTEMETELEFLNDKTIRVGLQFKSRETGTVFQSGQVELKPGNSNKTLLVKPQQDGWIFQRIEIKDSDQDRSLLVKYQNGGASFSKYIHIPYYNRQPDMSFYPEGGNLIANTTNRVAFKVLLPDGNNANISGEVYNARGEVQTTFSTLHDGMGDFSFIPAAGENYYAQIDYRGQALKFGLPETSPSAVSLRAIWEEEALNVSLRKDESVALIGSYLLMHHQGVPVFFEAWDKLNEEKVLNQALFRTGVNHLMLLDENLRPVSERLVFYNRNDQPVVHIQPDKATYSPREQINMAIHFERLKQDTIPVTFALSVTDDKDVKPDTTTNIIAETLLVSELKGNITNPAWYFSTDSLVTPAADLLMLTHGWRNYYVDDALQGDIHLVSVRPELTQSITGVLKTPRGRPADRGIIQMTVLGYDIKEAVEADEEGRFRFDDFELPAQTAIQLYANNKKKTTDVEIHTDEMIFPKIAPSLIREYTSLKSRIISPEFRDFVAKSDRKFELEHGTRIVSLPEIVIEKKIDRREYYLDNKAFIKHPRRWLSYKELEETPLYLYADLFIRLGIGDKYEPSDHYKDYDFVVDGVYRPTFPDDLPIQIEDIIQAEYVNDPSYCARYGPEIPYLIVLTTRSPWDKTKEEMLTPYTKIFVPLGYQSPAEFYSPQYDTPEAKNDPTPDLRSTIYWKPNVVLQNTDKATVGFYSADAKTSYSVIIEGIGNNRQLIYYKGEAVIKVETMEKDGY